MVLNTGPLDWESSALTTNIGYIKIKKIDDYENIYSVNPLYLMIGEVIGHIEHSSAEENNESKYLVLDSSDKNKEVLKNYKELWDGIKSEIQIINSGECNSIKCSSAETGEYGKDLKKIKFDSDDLPLTIVVRSVFEDEGKFYQQVYLDECLYEL